VERAEVSIITGGAVAPVYRFLNLLDPVVLPAVIEAINGLLPLADGPDGFAFKVNYLDE